MRKINQILGLVFALLIVSCSSDDDQVVTSNSNTPIPGTPIINLNAPLTGEFSQLTIGNTMFSERWRHQAVSFNNKIWVIGGQDFAGYKNDIWSSTDGMTWEEQTPIGTHFSPRSLHTVVVFNNKIWVVGGQNSSGNLLNEIWNSSDGVNWVQANNAPNGNVFTPTLTIFNNKLWLIGGRSSNGQSNNDIWSTADGITWNEEVATGHFSPRFLHQTFVIDNKLFVTGGNDDTTVLNDTWSSVNGVDWIEESNSNVYSPRYYHNTIVQNNNKVFLIGGAFESGGANYKDLFHSVDGVNWVDNIDVFPAGFSERRGQQTVLHNNSIFVIGGNTASSAAGSTPALLNEIWKYDF